MKRLYRIRIVPRSPWRTPWQADSLTGLLCWMCARTEGPDVVRREITEPMRTGEPPFVVSDAFPGDLLPVPVAARLAAWPPELRKQVKRAQWVRSSALAQFRRGHRIAIQDLVLAVAHAGGHARPVESPVLEQPRLRNALGRLTDATGAEGALFAVPEFHFNLQHPALHECAWLSVYVRVLPEYESRLLGLFAALADAGFGADSSAGSGAFDFPDGTPVLEPAGSLGEVPDGADGVIVLSTFQPAPTDPVEGWWENFTKFGKLGPDFGIRDVRKNPIVLLKPGACFRGAATKPFLGRAIPMEEILRPDSAAVLAERGVMVVHPAFGLAVPTILGVNV